MKDETELTRRVDRLEALMREAVEAKNEALRADTNAAYDRLRADMRQRDVLLMVWVAMVGGLVVAVLSLIS